MVVLLLLALLTCAVGSAHAQQQKLASTFASILQDDRYGPDRLGYYDYRYHTGNGIYHEESGNPLPDGDYAVAGSYSYTSPEGHLVWVTYAADSGGFRAHVAPTGALPPAPPHAIRQILAAQKAFSSKGEVYTNAYSDTSGSTVEPHPGHLPQGLLVEGVDRITAHEAHLSTQALLAEERQLALEKFIADQKRLELEKRLEEEERRALQERVEEQRRVAERLALERRLAAEKREEVRRKLAEQIRMAEQRRAEQERRKTEEKRAAERRRVAGVRRRIEDDNRLAQSLRQKLNEKIRTQRLQAAQQGFSPDRVLALEQRLGEERRQQEIVLKRRFEALQQMLKPSQT